MLRITVGIFIVLHGLVHLLYAGQSQRFFELQSGMVWPDGSWAFSKLLRNETTRLLATICCVLAAVGFVAGGAGLLLKQDWWRLLVVGSTAFSSTIIVLFWDGKTQMLDDQGFVGLLINIVILIALLVLRWPDFGF